jgi:hypothetical protein
MGIRNIIETTDKESGGKTADMPNCKMRMIAFSFLVLAAAGIWVSGSAALSQALPNFKPLAPLACEGKERIVILVAPVETPDVMGIIKRTWSSGLGTMFFPGSLLGLGGAIAELAHSPVEDSTPEFKKAITAAIGSADFHQLMLSRSEGVIKPRTSCETVFMGSSLMKPVPLQPSDKVIGIGFNFAFIGGNPKVHAYLSAMSMSGENANRILEGAEERERTLQEMKKLEPYVRDSTKKPDMKKLKEYLALSQKLSGGTTPYLDGIGMFNGESSSHPTNDWVVGDGKLAMEEISGQMDKLTGKLADMLFK